MMGNNIYGLGTDILEIARLRRLIESHGTKALSRLFTPKERLYCLKHKDPVPHFAGRFSAKEAIVKALGCGFGKQASWHDIEILNNDQGKPDVFLSPALAAKFKNPKILLSISHCKNYATATAIWAS